MEDIAPWKKNQICIKSLFFYSLAVALALCLNSQKVSFLICQIIIKSTFYPVGFLNEVLRNVYKNITKTAKYFLTTNIKYIPQSLCLKFSSHKNDFLKGEMCISLSQTLTIPLPLTPSGAGCCERSIVATPECAWFPCL